MRSGSNSLAVTPSCVSHGYFAFQLWSCFSVVIYVLSSRCPVCLKMGKSILPVSTCHRLLFGGNGGPSQYQDVLKSELRLVHFGDLQFSMKKSLIHLYSI